MPILRPARLATALFALLATAAGAAEAPLQLHRPSPDWRDQVLYFVMTDRFDDGDASNNDQGAGEFRAGSRAHYNGGDFAGLMRRLDYIRGLGVTGLWITPPVLNQWWNGNTNYSGYHGYWAADFGQVDPHLGTLQDYQRLSDALHRRGMTLVQDIVVNHTGDFFDYRGGWSPRDPVAHWQPNEGSRPLARPSQPPFDRNDPRDAAQRRDGIYHWTPDVRRYDDPQQVLNWQMSGLDDLNTEHPLVRRTLRQSYAHWIREVGVDAYRVDTAFYVPAPYFDDLLHARDAGAPGLLQVARQTGRNDFYTFGEGFAIDRPFEDGASRRIERYATTAQGRPRLSGMLHFPLYGALGAVMARGAPTAELAHRIRATMRLHRDPHRMATFVDNHDVDRFLAGGSEAGLKQALLAILTLPGVPVVYYGTEQGFTQPRAAMFAAGWESGGRDRFDEQAPLYRWLQRAIALRLAQPTLRRGSPVVLRDNAAGAGVIAWRMDPERGSGEPPLLVLMNTAERETLLDALPVGAAPQAELPLRYAIDGTERRITAGPDGRLTLVLPPRSGYVLELPRQPRPPVAVARPRLLQAQLSAEGDRLQVQGLGAPGQALRVLLDGNVPLAAEARADAQGRWQAALDTRALIDPKALHRVVAWDEAGVLASDPLPQRLRRQWTGLVDQADPPGDDHGPAGSPLRYRYPTDPSWGPNRQMDLRRVRLSGAGDALRIELDLHRVTRSWNPPQQFDHVAFTVFIGRPGREGGQTAMPLQDGELPQGMRWHWRLRVHGWSNALFSAAGSGPQAEGTPIAPGATVEVDAARHRVILTLPGGLLGPLEGLQVYVNTWDWDSGYRALAAEPGGHVVGGGPGPRVMDDFGPVTLGPPKARQPSRPR